MEFRCYQLVDFCPHVYLQRIGVIVYIGGHGEVEVGVGDINFSCCLVVFNNAAEGDIVVDIVV